MTNTKSAETDSVVRYEITLTVTRAVRYDHDEPLAEQEAWRLSRDAKRDLEREVLKAVAAVAGDWDGEVLNAEIVGLQTCTLCDGDGFNALGGNCSRCGGSGKEAA